MEVIFRLRRRSGKAMLASPRDGGTQFMRTLALVLIGTIAGTGAFACDTIADKVCRLENADVYTPVPPSDASQGNNYILPQCVKPEGDANFTNKRDMIQSAFDRAGTVSKLKTDLCTLTYIFIDVPQDH